jgi:hypothetical protein
VYAHTIDLSEGLDQAGFLQNRANPSSQSRQSLRTLTRVQIASNLINHGSGLHQERVAALLFKATVRSTGTVEPGARPTEASPEA